MGAGCVLITDDFLPHIGGSRIYYHRLATLLAGDVSVVTRTHPESAAFDSELPYEIERIILRGRDLGGPAVVGDIADVAALARGALAAPVSPVCYLAGEVNPSAFAAMSAARCRGVAYGVFLHDEPLAGAGSLEAALRRRVLREAGAIIVSSRFSERRAGDIVGTKVPVYYAPPGVDLDIFTPGEPDGEVLALLGVERDRYLLYVGRLVAYKNVSALIRVVAALAKRDLGLVVVGEGPDRDSLAGEARRLKVGGRVHFAGRVETSLLASLYRGALAYVFPSRKARGLQHEGVGMALLEAAACGCAVVASHDTSADDVITDGETGLLFDAGDPASLQSVVERLLSDPEGRKKMAAAGASLVRREFTWSRTAATVAEVISRLSGRISSL